MLQTLIAAVIVVLVAVWMLKIALTRINSPSNSNNISCGGGCSCCTQSTMKKTNCGGITPPQE